MSFHGLIVSRDLRQSDCPSQRLPNDLVELPKFGPVKMSAIKDLQLGFTLLENKIIQLRVRDLRSSNTISVYLDFRRTTYVDGILPGKYCTLVFIAIATFSNPGSCRRHCTIFGLKLEDLVFLLVIIRCRCPIPKVGEKILPNQKHVLHI